jgi:AcrR family transcriptional regulator
MRTKDFDKQQRIKRAMVRLILEEGISGASISKIAREADVSSATIYVYYNSKEEMLAEVFRECSHDTYLFLKRRLSESMSAAELIEAIVRGYYDYSVENEEIFSFVEQCSRCPTLSGNVCEEECYCGIFDLLHAFQSRGEIRNYSDVNLNALLFAPVRFLSMQHRIPEDSRKEHLSELVDILQTLLIC